MSLQPNAQWVALERLVNELTNGSHPTRLGATFDNGDGTQVAVYGVNHFWTGADGTHWVAADTSAGPQNIPTRLVEVTDAI